MNHYPHKVDNWFVQVDRHYGVFVAVPIPVPAPNPWGIHASIGNLGMPLAGFGESKANDLKLWADGSVVVARCHEPKMFIAPHLNVFPPPPLINVFLPLLVFASSSKCEFAAGAVRCKDGAMAVSALGWIGPNLACNDPVPFPTSFVETNGTVWVGFTWGDVIAGFVCIGFDMAKDWLEGKAFGALFGNKYFKGLFKKGLNGLYRRLRPPKVKLSDLVPGGGLTRSARRDAQRAAQKEFEPRAKQFDKLAERMSGSPSPSRAKAPPLTYDGDQPLEAIAGTLWGRTVGGDWDLNLWGKSEDQWLWEVPILGGLITGDLVTGDGGFADQLGAWIDRESEYVASDPVPEQPPPPVDPTMPQATGVMPGSGTVTLPPQPVPDLGLSPEDLPDLNK